MGFDAIITNAYIALEHYGDTARKKGIHEIVDFDGVVMTDSGGYQVLSMDPLILKLKSLHNSKGTLEVIFVFRLTNLLVMG